MVEELLFLLRHQQSRLLALRRVPILEYVGAHLRECLGVARRLYECWRLVCDSFRAYEVVAEFLCVSSCVQTFVIIEVETANDRVNVSPRMQQLMLHAVEERLRCA